MLQTIRRVSSVGSPSNSTIVSAGANSKRIGASPLPSRQWVGLYIEISAKLILGRRFGIVAANRGVQDSGPYRFVRHPMYLGYTIVHAGFLLGFPSLWNAVLYGAELAIQIVRLLREERLLNNDASYRDYAQRVPYRLLPLVF